jgi:hypothetical protein
MAAVRGIFTGSGNIWSCEGHSDTINMSAQASIFFYIIPFTCVLG